MCKNPSTNLSVGPPPFRQGRRQKFIYLYADKLKFTEKHAKNKAGDVSCLGFVYLYLYFVYRFYLPYIVPEKRTDRVASYYSGGYAVIVGLADLL